MSVRHYVCRDRFGEWIDLDGIMSAARVNCRTRLHAAATRLLLSRQRAGAVEPVCGRLAFEDDLRDGVLGGVRHRKVRVRRAEFVRVFEHLSGEDEISRAALAR